MVANVKILQQLEVVSEVVSAEQCLDGRRFVLKVEEGRPAHLPDGGDSPRQSKPLGGFFGLLSGLDIGEGCDGGGVVAGAEEPRRVGVYAPVTEALELDGAVGDEGVLWVHIRIRRRN